MCPEMPCPFCFQVMDKFNGHVECCMAGGDAVLRHNECRDITHNQANRARTEPHLEAQGLFRQLGEPGRTGARPADTLLCAQSGVRTARKRLLPKVALDFGFVNPQAACHIAEASQTRLSAATAYTDTKRRFNQTDVSCAIKCWH